eukprot:3231122-Pyramimonas_sp.AAC.1
MRNVIRAAPSPPLRIRLEPGGTFRIAVEISGPIAPFSSKVGSLPACDGSLPGKVGVAGEGRGHILSMWTNQVRGGDIFCRCGPIG